MSGPARRESAGLRARLQRALLYLRPFSATTAPVGSSQLQPGARLPLPPARSEGGSLSSDLCPPLQRPSGSEKSHGLSLLT